MRVRQKVADRIGSGLKRFQPILQVARACDINESDTVVLATDFLQHVLGFAAGLLTTFAFVPQVIHIWKSKSARDVSFHTFASFTLGVALPEELARELKEELRESTRDDPLWLVGLYNLRPFLVARKATLTADLGDESRLDGVIRFDGPRMSGCKNGRILQSLRGSRSPRVLLRAFH